MEECVLISRKGSSSSGVGCHNSLEEGRVLISRRGSYLAGGEVRFDREGDHTFAGQGVHFDLEGSATSIRSNGVWSGASSC